MEKRLLGVTVRAHWLLQGTGRAPGRALCGSPPRSERGRSWGSAGQRASFVPSAEPNALQSHKAPQAGGSPTTPIHPWVLAFSGLPPSRGSALLIELLEKIIILSRCSRVPLRGPVLSTDISVPEVSLHLWC